MYCHRTSATLRQSNRRRVGDSFCVPRRSRVRLQWMAKYGVFHQIAQHQNVRRRVANPSYATPPKNWLRGPWKPAVSFSV